MRKSGTECRERKQKVGESRFGTAPSFCAFVTDTHSSGVNTWRTWRTNIRTCSFIAYSVPKSARILSPAELLPKLWRYFAGIGRNHRIPILAAGGIPNHVHLLIVLPSDVSVAKAVQILKANASRWIRQHGIAFAWQEGYGASSVSSSSKAAVTDYIEHQAEHHRGRSYEMEFEAMIRKSGLRFDVQRRLGSVVPSGVETFLKT